MNILLKSSYIFDTERKTTFAGFILIEGTRIKDVGPLDATPTNLPAETTIIDCHDQMIIPGFYRCPYSLLSFRFAPCRAVNSCHWNN